MVSVLVSAGPPGFGPLVGLGEGEAPRIEIQYLKVFTREEIFMNVQKKKIKCKISVSDCMQ